MAIMTAAGMGVTQKESVADVIQQPLEKVRVIATQYEMKTLQTAVTNEVIAENMRSVERDFTAFVHSIAHSDAKDVANDHWGSAYELQKTEDGYLIVSAGPDMEFDSDDDIFASVRTY
jgi:hypothetical protein